MRNNIDCEKEKDRDKLVAILARNMKKNSGWGGLEAYGEETRKEAKRRSKP